MKSMYDLTQAYQSLLEMTDTDGEITEEMSRAWTEIEGAIDEKIQGTAFVIERLKSQASEVSKEIDRLYARKKSIERAQEALGDRLRDFMRYTNVDKVKTPYVTVSLGKPSVSVKIESIDDLPKQLCRLTYTPDKDAITRQLKQGEEVPGAVLVEGKPRLTIR